MRRMYLLWRRPIFIMAIELQFDRDLSGEFSSMPWTLKGHLPYDFNMDDKLHTAYRHLYALGHDAYLIHDNLNHLKNDDSLTILWSNRFVDIKR